MKLFFKLFYYYFLSFFSKQVKYINEEEETCRIKANEFQKKKLENFLFSQGLTKNLPKNFWDEIDSIISHGDIDLFYWFPDLINTNRMMRLAGIVPERTFFPHNTKIVYLSKFKSIFKVFVFRFKGWRVDSFIKTYKGFYVVRMVK